MLIPTGCRVAQAHRLAAKLVGEQPGMLLGQQLVLQDRERRCLQRPFADREGVCAGSALLLPGAPVIVLARDGIVGAAGAAPDKTRQQVLPAVLPGGRDLRLTALPPCNLRLHRAPLVVGDDAQIRHRDLDPLGGVTQPVAALAPLAVGVAPPLASSPDQPADIERIVEDTRRLFRVAADRRGVPLAATRAGDAIGVEAGGDLDGRSARGELGEDAPDDVGLTRVDLEEPADGLASYVQPHDALIAIGASACEPPGQHRRFHAAHRLVDQVLQEDCPQQPGDGELDLVDMALRHRVECYPVVHQLLAEERDVLGVARQPVECLAHDDVDHPGLDIAEQLLQPRPVAAIARLFWVVIGRDDRTAQIVDQLHACRGLVTARGGALHCRRVTAIERDARGRAHQHG
ncbi:hypothetical protein ABC319_12145 [Sphingomonas sp. 1P08PE]